MSRNNLGRKNKLFVLNLNKIIVPETVFLKYILYGYIRNHFSKFISESTDKICDIDDTPNKREFISEYDIYHDYAFFAFIKHTCSHVYMGSFIDRYKMEYYLLSLYYEIQRRSGRAEIGVSRRYRDYNFFFIIFVQKLRTLFNKRNMWTKLSRDFSSYIMIYTRKPKK
ncbi:hypothetical protein V1478_008644 [Vespula squamosa]|uniref:Maturase K n=1 Tax=Vespula squamosa TaxID=30214 RepID=A0ABD2AUT0_VESSQ